jgi:hypothetical protein
MLAGDSLGDRLVKECPTTNNKKMIHNSNK